MVRGAPEEVSQVLSVARVSKGGKLTLKKLVREHLGLAAPSRERGQPDSEQQPHARFGDGYMVPDC